MLEDGKEKLWLLRRCRCLLDVDENGDVYVGGEVNVRALHREGGWASTYRVKPAGLLKGISRRLASPGC